MSPEAAAQAVRVRDALRRAHRLVRRANQTVAAEIDAAGVLDSLAVHDPSGVEQVSELITAHLASGPVHVVVLRDHGES